MKTLSNLCYNHISVCHTYPIVDVRIIGREGDYVVMAHELVTGYIIFLHDDGGWRLNDKADKTTAHYISCEAAKSVMKADFNATTEF